MTEKHMRDAEMRMAHSIEEAAEITNVGRTKIYEAIRNNELRTLKVGRRRLVRTEALRDWLRRLEQGVA